uniref:Uncharacterized protein n=1 Tax=Arundo donax TaxID=35708 RepID=A0A0A9AMU3_ARUDO
MGVVVEVRLGCWYPIWKKNFGQYHLESECTGARLGKNFRTWVSG